MADAHAVGFSYHPNRSPDIFQPTPNPPALHVANMDVTSAASRPADRVFDNEGDLVLAVGVDSEEGEENFLVCSATMRHSWLPQLGSRCSLAHGRS